MSGHTPGPWDYRSQPHDDWGVVRAGRYIICQARDPNVDHLDLSHYRRTKTDPFEANARLISAAPDLLEQLESCVAFLDKHCPGAGHIVDAADAAIAKASHPASNARQDEGTVV